MHEAQTMNEQGYSYYIGQVHSNANSSAPNQNRCKKRTAQFTNRQSAKSPMQLCETKIRRSGQLRTHTHSHVYLCILIHLDTYTHTYILTHVLKTHEAHGKHILSTY